MRAVYVVPVRTPCTPLELAQGYELALGGDGKVDWPYIAVLMAHGVLECGRDTKTGLIMTSCWNHNLGNVKAGPDYPGHYTCIRLNEYLTENGARHLVWFSPEGREPLQGVPIAVPPGHPQTRMRAHLSLEDGIAAKLSFLAQPRFAKALAAARRGDAAGYVNAIHAQKYFTANLDPYLRAVVSLAQSYGPVARRVAETPLLLKPELEAQINAVITAHSAAPSMLDPNVPLVDLANSWQGGVKSMRDEAVRDGDE